MGSRGIPWYTHGIPRDPTGSYGSSLGIPPKTTTMCVLRSSMTTTVVSGCTRVGDLGALVVWVHPPVPYPSSPPAGYHTHRLLPRVVDDAIVTFLFPCFRKKKTFSSFKVPKILKIYIYVNIVARLILYLACMNSVFLR